MSKPAKSAKLAGTVIASVFLFIFAFSAAGSWLLLVEHLIPGKDSGHVKAFAVLATVMTLLTLGLALAFAFTTRNSKTKVPLDFSTLVKNVQADVDGERSHKLYIKPHVPFEI
jgi:hypothetical protein